MRLGDAKVLNLLPFESVQRCARNRFCGIEVLPGLGNAAEIAGYAKCQDLAMPALAAMIDAYNALGEQIDETSLSALGIKNRARLALNGFCNTAKLFLLLGKKRVFLG